MGGARLRGSRQGPAACAEVAGRQRRAGRGDDRLRDRQGVGGRAARGARLRRARVRLLGQEGPGLPRRPEGPQRQPVRARPQAGDPLPPGRRRRRDRALELPADELVRRRDPGARRRQRGCAQAVRDNTVDVAADGRVHARVRHARGHLRRHPRLRRDRCRAGRPRRHDHVHGLHAHGQEDRRAGGRAADPGQPRARRQGPDDRARRRRPRARRQRRRPLLDAERRPDVHLDGARLRRGAGLRRVRRQGHREGQGAAPGQAGGAGIGRPRSDHLPAPGRHHRVARLRTRARRARRSAPAGTCARTAASTGSRPSSPRSTTRWPACRRRPSARRCRS